MKVYSRRFHEKRKRYPTTSNHLMGQHKTELILLGAFLAGVVIVNLLGKQISLEVSLLNQYYIKHLIQAEFVKGEVFWYLFQKRMPFLFLLFVLHFTNIRTIVMRLFFLYMGFGMGVIMSTFVISFGAMGIMVALVAMFPQMLMYAFGYLLLMKLSALTVREMQEGGLGTKYKVFFVFCAMVFLIIIFGGIFLESYVNPYFLKKIVKIL